MRIHKALAAASAANKLPLIVSHDKDNFKNGVLVRAYVDEKTGTRMLLTASAAPVSPITDQVLAPASKKNYKLSAAQIKKLPIIGTCGVCDTVHRTIDVIASKIGNEKMYCTTCGNTILAADDDDMDNIDLDSADDSEDYSDDDTVDPDDDSGEGDSEDIDMSSTEDGADVPTEDEDDDSELIASLHNKIVEGDKKKKPATAGDTNLIGGDAPGEPSPATKATDSEGPSNTGAEKTFETPVAEGDSANSNQGGTAEEPANDGKGAISNASTEMNMTDLEDLTNIKDKNVELVASASDSDPAYYVMVNRRPIAIASFSKASAGVKKIFRDTAKYGKVFYQLAADGLDAKDMGELGIESLTVNVPTNEYTESVIKTETAKIQALADTRVAEARAHYRHAASIAALGLVKNLFNDNPNPLYDGVVAALKSINVRNPGKIATKVFANHSEEFIRKIFAKADELVQDDVSARNATAKHIQSAKFLTVADDESSDVGLELSEANKATENNDEGNDVKVSEAKNVNTASTEVTAGYNPQELRKVIRFNRTLVR